MVESEVLALMILLLTFAGACMFIGIGAIEDERKRLENENMMNETDKMK